MKNCKISSLEGLIFTVPVSMTTGFFNKYERRISASELPVLRSSFNWSNKVEMVLSKFLSLFAASFFLANLKISGAVVIKELSKQSSLLAVFSCALKSHFNCNNTYKNLVWVDWVVSCILTICDSIFM